VLVYSLKTILLFGLIGIDEGFYLKVVAALVALCFSWINI